MYWTRDSLNSHDTSSISCSSSRRGTFLCYYHYSCTITLNTIKVMTLVFIFFNVKVVLTQGSPQLSNSLSGSVALRVQKVDDPHSNPHVCSPFKFRVLPTHDASKVRASGPGLTSGVPASLPVEFNIDAKDAGQGQLSVLITVSEAAPHTHPSRLLVPSCFMLVISPLPGPRRETQTAQYPRQRRRHVPGVVHPRPHGTLHHRGQVRWRRHPRLAIQGPRHGQR